MRSSTHPVGTATCRLGSLTSSSPGPRHVCLSSETHREGRRGGLAALATGGPSHTVIRGTSGQPQRCLILLGDFDSSGRCGKRPSYRRVPNGKKLRSNGGVE